MRSARLIGDSVDDRLNDEEFPESQNEEPTPELAKELLKHSARLAKVIRSQPELLQSLLAGYEAWEAASELLTANNVARAG